MNPTFRQRLNGGETLFGTIVTLPTAATAEILADAGFDWLFIDAEHSALDYPAIQSILQAVGDRVPCLVRLPDATEVPIKKTLDLGAAGIIAPQIITPEQAQAVVNHARYSPQGTRGVGLGRAHGYGMRFAEYLETANDQVTVIVQAEHIDAANNIEAILDIEGIDAIQLGPYDLSASLGKKGDITDPEVTGAIDRIIDSCREKNIPVGYFGVDAAAVQPYCKKGCSLLVAGVDTLFLGSRAKETLAEMKFAS